jgi:4-hydroxy-3-polyprenylbenzoate decarboxylase
MTLNYKLMKRKIIIAITGASGSIYAKRLLEKLEIINAQFDACDLVFSSTAKEIWKYELGTTPDELSGRFTIYEKNNFYAPFASGSAGYDTMIIIPCSMGTLGRIASGVSDDLITRAADVMLKEREKLILVIRETPYNLIHLKNMTSLTEAGAIILPATPSFYSLPQTIDDLVDTVVNRVLDLAGFENDGFKWQADKTVRRND